MTVRGGGIFGLSIAWVASLRGAKVRLIETAHIGAGSSGGIVGALCPHVPELWNGKKAFQLDSLLMAAEFWAGVQAASGLHSGYARLGRLQPVLNQAALDLALARVKTAANLWGDAAVWRVQPASVWGPQTEHVIFDSLSARLHPRLACAALTQALRAAGAELILGRDADTIGPVVWATGLAGLNALTQDLGRNMGGAVKGQSILLEHDARDQPQVFADWLHIVPHLDGTVAIGSTSENTWAEASTTDGQLDALHARALAILPVLQGAKVLDRWAGLRPRAINRAPLMGAWPGRDGHFIANGGFKIGFGMAPKVAQCMVDLVLERRDTIPDDFRL